MILNLICLGSVLDAPWCRVANGERSLFTALLVYRTPPETVAYFTQTGSISRRAKRTLADDFSGSACADVGFVGTGQGRSRNAIVEYNWRGLASGQSQCATSYRVRNAITIMEPDDQADKPYEQWAQHPPDPWIPWRRRLSMAALGAGAGLLMGAVVHVVMVVTRPDLPTEISWSSLAYFCFGGAICALIESWKG